MTDEETAECVRVTVYRRFATTGRSTSAAETAVELGITDDESLRAYRKLHENRHFVLSPEGDVIMAHPFASENFNFSVMGERVIWWGGCAWDAFAIPHIVDAEPSVLVATNCPSCSTAHAWTVGRDAPPEGDQLAHFLTPMAHVWDDVVHACHNQQIFCDEACLESWLARTGHERGATFDLASLWRLASHWYEGRLEPGYRRREPAAAADYFASVGLNGKFWGN